jgi:hypothetical protein
MFGQLLNSQLSPYHPSVQQHVDPVHVPWLLQQVVALQTGFNPHKESQPRASHVLLMFGETIDI